jgi:hypothetical protein
LLRVNPTRRSARPSLIPAWLRDSRRLTSPHRYSIRHELDSVKSLKNLWKIIVTLFFYFFVYFLDKKFPRPKVLFNAHFMTPGRSIRITPKGFANPKMHTLMQQRQQQQLTGVSGQQSIYNRKNIRVARALALRLSQAEVRGPAEKKDNNFMQYSHCGQGAPLKI